MTVYFQGSEAEALWFNPADGNLTEQAVIESTTWSRAGVTIDGTSTGSFILSDAGQEVNPFWYHDYFKAANANAMNGGNYYSLVIEDGSGVPAIRFYNSLSEAFQPQYWDGTIWVNFGVPVDIPHGGATWDVRVKLGNGTTTTDLIEIYKNEILVGSKEAINFLKAHFTGFRYAKRRNVPNLGLVPSQCMIVNEPTLDWNCKTLVPTSLGTDATDGTGAVTDVNEQNINNDTFIGFTAAGQRRSFKAPARTLTNRIKGFTAAARIRLAVEASPDKVKPYVIPAGTGTRYYGTTFTLTLGYRNYQYTWQVNPATGVEWTPSEINNVDLEWGWETVA